MAKHKKIDITLLNKEALKKITFEDLISDAAARKDKAAYEFLCSVLAESKTKAPRERRRIQTIRREYLETFCGYNAKPKQTKPASMIEKQQQMLDSIANLFE